MLAEDLVRELAGRRYQPLLSRLGWMWTAALEWARPVAVVVDSDLPGVLSEAFVVASSRVEAGLVIFGDPAKGANRTPLATRGAVVTVAARDARLIGRAVDAVVKSRLA
jgi:hypothetical protein